MYWLVKDGGKGWKRCRTTSLWCRCRFGIYMYSIVCVRVNYSFWKTGTPFNYSDDSGDDDDDRAPDDIQTSDPDDEENGYNDGVINDEIHNGLLRRISYHNCSVRTFCGFIVFLLSSMYFISTVAVVIEMLAIHGWSPSKAFSSF